MRRPGLEPGAAVWKTAMLPLHQQRKSWEENKTVLSWLEQETLRLTVARSNQLSYRTWWEVWGSNPCANVAVGLKSTSLTTRTTSLYPPPHYNRLISL